MKKYIVHFTTTEAGIQPPLETIGELPVNAIYEKVFDSLTEARSLYLAEMAAAATRGDVVSYDSLGFTPTEREDALHCTYLELASIIYDEDGGVEDIESIGTKAFWI